MQDSWGSVRYGLSDDHHGSIAIKLNEYKYIVKAYLKAGYELAHMS